MRICGAFATQFLSGKQCFGPGRRYHFAWIEDILWIQRLLDIGHNIDKDRSDVLFQERHLEVSNTVFASQGPAQGYGNAKDLAGSFLHHFNLCRVSFVK